MALVRQDLREELVAVIAAGRELAPEYDALLADHFLESAQSRLGSQAQPTPQGVFIDQQLLKTIGAVALAFAAVLLAATLLFHGIGGPDGAYMDRSGDGGANIGQHWHGDNLPGFQNSGPQNVYP